MLHGRVCRVLKYIKEIYLITIVHLFQTVMIKYIKMQGFPHCLFLLLPIYAAGLQDIQVPNSLTVNNTILECLNGGQLVLIKELQGGCSDQTNKQECNTIRNACYCPADYVGERCEIWNQVICDLSLPFDYDCPEMPLAQQMGYNYKPPCKFVDESTIYYQQVNVLCKNKHQVGERVHHHGEFRILKNQTLAKFDYELTSSLLKLQKNITVSATLTFLTWKKLFQPKFAIKSDLLSFHQIIGISNVVFELNFSRLQNLNGFNRYNFNVELSLSVVGNDQEYYNPQTKGLIGYFEQKIPLSVPQCIVYENSDLAQSQNLQFIFLLIGLLLLLIGCIASWRYMRGAIPRSEEYLEYEMVHNNHD